MDYCVECHDVVSEDDELTGTCTMCNGLLCCECAEYTAICTDCIQECEDEYEEDEEYEG